MVKQNILEVNGKQYDASTGQLVGQPAGQSVEPLAKNSHSRQSIAVTFHDGPAERIPQRSAKQIHHRSQKSKTLMRSAVKKPKAVPSVKATAKAAYALTTPVITSSLHDKPERHKRAESIARSQHISRFGDSAPAMVVVTKTEIIAVQPAPPVHAPPVHKVAVPVPEPQLPLPTTRFERAIDNAANHTAPQHKKVRRSHKLAHKLHVSPKLVNAGATMMAVLLVGGFFAYQNAPNLAMRVASARAGVSGRLPTYQPSGYTLNRQVLFSPGEITLNYQSASDDRRFSVSQRKSNWNNDALVANYVSVGQRPYQTYQENGRTIYMYNGGSDATWLNSGIWYQIDGDEALTTDQLLRLASSL